MSNPTTDDSYLNFDEPETIESDQSTPASDDTDITQEENFSPADFAILAREANGYNFNNPSNLLDSQVDENGAQQSEEEEKENENLSPSDQKIKIRRPYLKIVVGVAITSIVVFCMLFMKYSWSKVMNAGKKIENPEKTFSVDPRKQEIDKLKAELALIEQSKKPIEPKPEPEPRPEPKPEPEPRPEPEPEPEPEPIDPYKQWEMLSQLGTLGNSALNSNIANLAQENSYSQTESEQPTALTAKHKERMTQISQTPSSEASKAENKIASVSLNDNLGINKNRASPASKRYPSQNNQSFTEPESKFSPDAQKIILSGLGVSPNHRGRGIANPLNTNDSNHKQIAIGSSAKGILTSSVAWTDSSKSENTRGSITLTEPLKSEQGNIALPEDSTLIVEVADWDDADFVTLNVVAIVTENSYGEIVQQEIPEDSLLIRGENNQPLKFETENSDDSNSTIDKLLSSAVKGSTRNLPIPREVGSAISKTINESGSKIANEGKFHFIEAQTPIVVYVNNPVSINSQ